MPKHVYWKLADDGSDFRCASCGERSPASKMVVLEDTTLALGDKGFRQTLHNDGWCVDVTGLECKGTL